MPRCSFTRFPLEGQTFPLHSDPSCPFSPALCEAEHWMQRTIGIALIRRSKLAVLGVDFDHVRGCHPPFSLVAFGQPFPFPFPRCDLRTASHQRDQCAWALLILRIWIPFASPWHVLPSPVPFCGDHPLVSHFDCSVLLELSSQSRLT
jgi:hypothetical protein